MYETKSRRLRSQKVLMAEEELDGIDIDDITNLEDLLRLVFIDKEFGNLKVELMVKSLLEILTKRKIRTFYKPIDIIYSGLWWRSY